MRIAFIKPSRDSVVLLIILAWFLFSVVEGERDMSWMSRSLFRSRWKATTFFSLVSDVILKLPFFLSSKSGCFFWKVTKGLHFCSTDKCLIPKLYRRTSTTITLGSWILFWYSGGWKNFLAHSIYWVNNKKRRSTPSVHCSFSLIL